MVGDGADGDDCHCVIGIQRTLMNSLASRNQYQQLWRHGWQQTQLRAISPPANWQVNRNADIAGGMWSASALRLFHPGAERREMTRLHCPESSVVRSRYVKGLPFQSSGRAGSVDGSLLSNANGWTILSNQEMILVQSTGMAQWLQMTLSQKFGLRQTLIFHAASELYLGYVRPGCYRKSPKRAPLTNKQSMSWKLMTLLPQLLGAKTLPCCGII